MFAPSQGGRLTRINVYAEELTPETALVTKTVNDAEFGERTFYGLRVFFHSPDQLHHSVEDDDRTAITFWARWTKAQGTDFKVIAEMLRGLTDRLNEAVNSVADIVLEPHLITLRCPECGLERNLPENWRDLMPDDGDWDGKMRCTQHPGAVVMEEVATA